MVVVVSQEYRLRAAMTVHLLMRLVEPVILAMLFNLLAA